MMQRRTVLGLAGASLTALGGCSQLGGVGPADSPNRPPANDALVIEASRPVNGTNVNLGAAGVAKNTASTTLVNCRIDATGFVGGQEYQGTAQRDRLAPGDTWEWQAAFGSEADASNDDSVEDISIQTSAEYAA